MGERDINRVRDIVFNPDITVILDTGVVIACGKPTNEKFVALSSFASRIESPLVIPQRVHEELGGSPEGYSTSNMAVDLAIEQGWLRVFDDLDYTNPKLSQVMDEIRNYIAKESKRSPNRVEKADPALGAVALQLLETDSVRKTVVITTDNPAGEGVQTALARQGYGKALEVLDGFDFVEDLSSTDYREI